MEKAKNILHILLIILLVLSLVVIGVFAYYKLFNNDTTIGVNYIGSQSPVNILEIKSKQELSEEEIEYYENRYLFNANVYDNSKGNGEELQEVRLDYFMDPSLLHTACRSTGMQFIGDYKSTVNKVGDKSEEYVNDLIVENLTYYDTTDMISWNGGKVATQLNRNTQLIIKIDNKPYLIQLTGKETWEEGWWLFAHEYTLYYGYDDVFADIMTAVKTNSRGYGDYYITLDLSQYFTVYAFNEETGKFVEDNISDKIFNYSVLKFHYSPDGVTKASQSMFGQVACNSKYGETDIDTSYWQEKVVYTLTEKDLSYRYSELYSGSLATLKVDILETLSKLENVEINVEIDTNSEYFEDNNINFVGFDFNAFEGVKLNNLVLKGSGTIKFLENSLKDTGLRKLIRSNAIVLDMDENAINSEFVGVVVWIYFQ